MKKRALPIVVVLVLALALVFNFYMQDKAQKEISNYYEDLLQPRQTYEPIADNAVKVFDQDGNHIGYAGIDKYNGFGGPMIVGITTDLNGIMPKTVGVQTNILDHKETVQYLQRITNEGYFEQFSERDIKEPMVFGVDIDGIAAATLSTRAFATAANNVAESIRVKGLGLPPSTASIPWQVGVAEIAIAAIAVLTLMAGLSKKFRKIRLPLLILSMVITGFWLNRPATMAQISGMFMGYFPVLKTNLIWYIVLAIAILPPIILGKNFYCNYMCPFGAAQELLHMGGKALKLNLPMDRKIAFLRKMRNLFTFIALLVAFLFQNPSVASYEPFNVLFKLDGEQIKYILCAAAVIAALFFDKMYCKGFCPVGGFLDIVAKYRRKLGQTIKNRGKEKPMKQEVTEVKKAPKEEEEEYVPQTKREKTAESLYKVFLAIMAFAVAVSFFVNWSIM